MESLPRAYIKGKRGGKAEQNKYPPMPHHSSRFHGWCLAQPGNTPQKKVKNK
jgi:hypothetical protein